MENENITTFWDLLDSPNEENTDNSKQSKGFIIEIPKIQRDYAQGRRGMSHKRNLFLREIKEKLDNGKKLSLDFVYGTVKNRRFCPLDGQQRLTTLWLLHWYLAFRLGKLKDIKVRKKLESFSYETRVSSREFCTALCEKMKDVDGSLENIPNVARYIKDRTWFYNSWLLDPTIDAMLRMLEGEDDEENDSIEKLFGIIKINAELDKAPTNYNKEKLDGYKVKLDKHKEILDEYKTVFEKLLNNTTADVGMDIKDKAQAGEIKIKASYDESEKKKNDIDKAKAKADKLTLDEKGNLPKDNTDSDVYKKELDLYEKTLQVYQTELEENARFYWEYQTIIYWKYLTEEGRIQFEKKVINSEQLPVSDDLYINMNARGKSLTDYENFKADLIKHIEELERGGLALGVKISDLDNKWVDLFWKLNMAGKCFDGRIDDLQFEFVNRFIVNQILLLEEAGEFKYSGSLFTSTSKGNTEERKKAKNFFNHLVGDEEEEANEKKEQKGLVEYEKFSDYQQYFTVENIKQIFSIFDRLDNDEILAEVKAMEADIGHRYFPQYAIDKNGDRKEPLFIDTGFRDRVYYCAISLFLALDNEFIYGCVQKEGSFNKDRFTAIFKQWMRVVKNIVNNVDLSTKSNMVTYIREIYKLSQGLTLIDGDEYKDFYSYLAELHKTEDSLVTDATGKKTGASTDDDKTKDSDTGAYSQIIEECEKARAIVKGDILENIIINAENSYFFRGTIRFLYHDGDGEVYWNNFNNKLQFFVNNTKENVISEDARKAFLKLLPDFPLNSRVFVGKGYAIDHDTCWLREVLWKKCFSKEVDELLLMSDDEINKLSQSKVLPQSPTIYQKFAYSNKIIQKILNGTNCDKSECIINGDKQLCIKLGASHIDGVVIGTINMNDTVDTIRPENEIINSLDKNGTIKVKADYYFYENGFCWGNVITFEYKGVEYSLKRDGKVIKTMGKSEVEVNNTLNDFVRENNIQL